MGWFGRKNRETKGSLKSKPRQTSAIGGDFDFEHFKWQYQNLKITPEIRASFEDQLRRHFELLPNLIRRFAEPHLPVLVAKRRQLIFYDDYGNVVDRDWRQEMDYFLTSNLAFSYFDLDGRDPAREQAYRLHVLDRYVVEAMSEYLDVGAPKYDSACTGVEFEGLVKCIFEEQGAQVSSTPVSGDQGVDLLVRFCGSKIAVQCKRSSSSIGNSAVQQASAGAVFYAADCAWVVSDAAFTKSARQLADSVGVRLVDFRLIAEQLMSLKGDDLH